MKQVFRNLAAVLCMLVLIATSASCMQMPSHSSASCGRCTNHQPIDQQTPGCCITHHQPSTTATALTVEQPADVSATQPSTIHLDTVALLSPSDQLVWPPPHPPRLTLRI